MNLPNAKFEFNDFEWNGKVYGNHAGYHFPNKVFNRILILKCLLHDCYKYTKSLTNQSPSNIHSTNNTHFPTKKDAKIEIGALKKSHKITGKMI